MSLLSFGGFALAFGLGACSRAGAGVVEPVELAIEPLVVDGGAPVGTTSATKPERRKTCTARLTAGEIDTGPGCILDERISHGPGKLSYPCEGDGAAQASFDDQVYDGKLSHGVLSLRLTTELDWEDGCRWQSEQVVGGRLVRTREAAQHGQETNDESATEPLQWRYEDRAIAGRGCSGACTAQAEIEVEPDDAR